MPIPLRCKCGHAMNVPDSAAGKVGKCPKCQQAIKVPIAVTQQPTKGSATNKAPTAKSAASSPAKASPAKAKVASAVVPTTANSKLDELFSQAGIGQTKGPTCPSCTEPIIPNSVICIGCGFNFESGSRIEGYQLSQSAEEFDNASLNEASRNIVRDQEAEARVKFAGSPWWVALAMVLGLCLIIYAGVERVQAHNLNEFAEKGTILFAFQKMPWVTVLPFIGSMVGFMVVFMSHIAVTVAAFRDTINQGFLVLFIPFYSIYYSIVNRIKLSTAANVHLIWWVLFIAFFSWFLGNRGWKYF